MESSPFNKWLTTLLLSAGVCSFSVHSQQHRRLTNELSPDTMVSVTVNDKTLSTGAVCELTATNIALECQFKYFLFDFGDGYQTVVGPFEKQVKSSRVKHSYDQPGHYAVRVKAISLSNTNETGWSAPVTVQVTGTEQRRQPLMVQQGIASSGEADLLVDNDATTCWHGKEDKDGAVWAGVLFDKNHRLQTLEIATSDEDFPSDFRIEYTTDGGTIWYPVPVYNLSLGIMTMRFPNPGSARLEFHLNGLCANAIRIVAPQSASMTIGEISVMGEDRFLFETDADDTTNADINNLWLSFGSACNEAFTKGVNWAPSEIPYKGGVTGYEVTEWQEWTGIKLNWFNDNDHRKVHKRALIHTKADTDGRNHNGYVWPSYFDPKHLGIHRKYSTNPIYIMAVRDFLLQCNDMEGFLEMVDAWQMVMFDKLELVMDYMLTIEEGRQGLLVITDPEHDGTATGGPSNYWDNITSFGYKSAYENALFYGSLIAMADIYTFCNMPHKADDMLQLANKVKSNYNEIFWDADKGRFIAGIDIKGNKHDYGFTYVNFMAIVYGVADEEKAKIIFEWIDGKRIIKDDTSTGADIYAFGYAPRSNTLAIESTGEPYSWFDWDRAIWPGPRGNSSYGIHLENGGTIFYVSYYDLMARLKTLGADNAFMRFEGILKEFHKDALHRNETNDKGMDWVEGILGPFPESGLVPAFFVRGIMGINAVKDGLEIAPRLPSKWNYAAINQVVYNNTVFRIETACDIKEVTVSVEGGIHRIRVPNGQCFLLKK